MSNPSNSTHCNQEENCAFIRMEDLNDVNFEIVYNGNDPIIENDQVLLCQKSDQTLIYVQENLVKTRMSSYKKGPSTLIEDVSYSDEAGSTVATCISTSSETDDSSSRNHWTRSDILSLIHLYEGHQSLFQSTTTKNEKVWQMIALKMKKFNSEQCKNKFKYLKSKYVKKKDNMSKRRTGEPPVKFEFFEKFDNIFKDDHNITPVATASSINSDQNVVGTPIADEDDRNSTNKKKKEKSITETVGKL